MPTKTWSSVRGRKARVTKVSPTGKPIANTCGSVVTDGFVSVNYAPEIEEGEEILVRNASGALCVNDKGCDTLKRITIEVEFCQVNPELLTLMTGSPTVVDHAGAAVGVRVAENVNCSINFALEVWTDIPAAGSAGEAQYGYFVTPNIVGGTIGELTLENDAATFTVASTTKSAAGWGYGPYLVDPTAVANTPGPLETPFIEGQHMDMHLTTVAPPANTAGCVEVTSTQVTTSETGA